MPQTDRAVRAQSVERQLEELDLDPEEHAHWIEQHKASETAHLRASRQKLGVRDFEPLDIIGRGAFGEGPCRPTASRAHLCHRPGPRLSRVP